MTARGLWIVTVFASALTAGSAAAQAPSGSTGQCKDGSYTSASSKSGACRGHQGIKTWFAGGTSGASASSTAPAAGAPAAAAPARSAPAATAAAPALSPAPAPAATAPATSSAASGKAGGKQLSPTARAANTPQAPGGGNGKVWVNTESKVYHCEGTTFYGKTKAGEYMTEADAKAAGAHPDRNKPCTK